MDTVELNESGNASAGTSDASSPAIADGRATDIVVVIVNYRTADHVRVCLGALAEERDHDPAFDVVVVDGGSGDGSAEQIAATIRNDQYQGWVELLALEHNGGFGWANNQALRRLTYRKTPPRYALLLNPDAVPQRDAVKLLYEALQAEPRAASAGSLLVTGDGQPQGSAFTFPTIRSEFIRGSETASLARLLGVRSLVTGESVVPAEWVTGASVMIRLDALREVGLFDEGFFLYYEEVELMHRLRAAGWMALHVPASRVIHIGGASTGIADGASQQRRLPRYWFRSRRRYFALTRGPMIAATASLAWLLGSAFRRLRHAVGLARTSTRAPHEMRDLLHHGIKADRYDITPAIPSLCSPVDRLPAWMTWEERTREPARFAEAVPLS